MRALRKLLKKYSLGLFKCCGCCGAQCDAVLMSDLMLDLRRVSMCPLPIHALISSLRGDLIRAWPVRGMPSTFTSHSLPPQGTMSCWHLITSSALYTLPFLAQFNKASPTLQSQELLT